MNTLSVGQCVTQCGAEYAINSVYLSGDVLRYSVIGMDNPTLSDINEHAMIFYKVANKVFSLDDLRARRVVVQQHLSLVEAQQQTEALARQAATVQAHQNADYSDLLKVGKNDSSDKIAVKNIRIMLKKHFPGVKFSVTMKHYGTVNVRWTDGSTKDAVESVISRFQEGRFNGMEDIYEFNGSPFNDVYGGVTYVFTSRERSDALIAEAIDALRKEYGETTIPDFVTVEAYKSGALHCKGEEFFFHGYQWAIGDAMGKIDKSPK